VLVGAPAGNGQQRCDVALAGAFEQLVCKGKEGADRLPVVAGCGEDGLGGDRGVVASSNSVLHVLDQHVVLDQLLEPTWPLHQHCMGVAGELAETLLVEDDLRLQRHE
jgi:hypothetical protein